MVKKRLQKPMRSDLAFISMIVIGLVVVLALLFIFFQTVLPLLTKSSDNQQVIVVPDPIDHETDPVDDPDDPDETVVFTVTKTSQTDKNGQLTNYEVTGYTVGDTVTVEIEIKGASSWISSKVDGVSTITPPARIYVQGEIYTLIVTTRLDRLIEVTVGNLKSQVLRINGTVIDMDSDLLLERTSSSFYFRFVENNP